jgi:Ca2+/Na+ antiporter
LTHYTIENSIADKFSAIFTTVSPKNSFSLQNVLGCKFVIIGIEALYGGYTRYILRKNFAVSTPIWTNGHLVIPLSDLKRQKEVIADGYVGYKIIRRNRGFSVLYAPIAEKPPKGYWKKPV